MEADLISSRHNDSYSSAQMMSVGSRGSRSSHGGFGEVMALTPISLIVKPGLVKWQPAGKGSTSSGSLSGSDRARTAPVISLPEVAGLEPTDSTFSSSGAATRSSAPSRSSGRAVSAPNLPKYCVPSKHLSGHEISTRKQAPRSGTRSLRAQSGGARSAASGGSLMDAELEGADGLSERAEVRLSLPLGPRRSTLERHFRPAEELREAIREELISLVGGPMEAFRSFDLAGSGRVSMQEFTDGIERLGVRWQEITGFRWMLHLFSLFDQNRDGVVDLEEFFPSDNRKDDGPRRLNTPDFLEHWCEWSDQYTNAPNRNPSWSAGEPRVELKRLFKAQKVQQDTADHRRWMSSMFRRLKTRGKSDAQVRECIAYHLPRGTGPKDRQSVQTFSEAEVTSCTKQYHEASSNKIRAIQKEVYNMRDQRQTLSDTRQQLFTVTGPLLAAYRHEEEKKTAAQNFQSYGLLGAKSSQETQDKPEAAAAPVSRSGSKVKTAEELGFRAEDIGFNASAGE